MSPRRVLPAHASLEQQKKLAKDLLKAHRSDDPEAIARVREHLPDRRRIALADAQFVIAREYGLRNWAALKTRIEGAGAGLTESAREEFRRVLDAGDADSLRNLFARHPAARALIDAPLFAFDAPAIVHFAWAGNLPIVNALLDEGADPNRRSDWWAGGFHALHLAGGEVAERLLAAGAVPDTCAAAHLDRLDLLEQRIHADPARVHERGGDGQTPLHFARSRDAIDLLLAHGADIDARDIDHRSTPAQWMLAGRRGAGRYALAEYLVEKGASTDVFMAAALGLAARLRRMLESDPSLLELRTSRGEYGEQPPSAEHIYTWTIGQNRSPLQVATQFDQSDAYDVLFAFAGTKQRLVAACAQARADQAEAILRESPGLLEQLNAGEKKALPDAAWAGNAAAVDLMLALGFDAAAGGEDGGTVLHCAAWQGAADCIETALRHDRVRDLLETHDPVHGGTPLGWCCHGSRHCRNREGDYPRVARLLLEAGARPGRNLRDATDEVLAVIREYATESG